MNEGNNRKQTRVDSNGEVLSMGLDKRKWGLLKRGDNNNKQ